ncbi:Alg9-like mannosyltransferase family-domain-containing protein [Elsinoe ampelina]|uniref:Mannosyltransferase n=1 Tax=Elsinoe ampelina TaxID=302913 RepID=A0A6A6G8H2_9PEZI|nr:Alg9-like mannosyltransferase family-domain-containing protein [Elsinoe ampelina]
MPKAIDLLLTIAIPALILVHLFAAPYTKVEESFNIQAIHDILTFGIPNPLDSDAVDYIKTNYDHASFPGSVPRTFVGASVLAGLARPFVGLLRSPEQVQLLVRGILGLINAAALVRFRVAVDVAYGRTAGRFYLAFVACQFQLLFYASRTLPNYLALPLTIEASRALLLSLSTSPKLRPSSRRRRLCLYLLTVSGIIFRSEVALLLATTAGTLGLFSGLKIRSELIPAVFAGALIALPTTLGLDTFLWRPRIALSLTYDTGSSTFQIPVPTWPELQAFLYNTIQGHSSEWGTSPFHYYFTSALPKLLLNPIHLLLIPLSLTIPALRRTSLTSLLPSLLFITLFSLLPHKEPRFIIYTLPLLLASSSSSASYLFTRRHKSPLYLLSTSLILLSLPLSLLLSTTTLYISTLNYPGAHALSLLHEMASPASLSFSSAVPAHIHPPTSHPREPPVSLSPSEAAHALTAAAAARHAASALRAKGHVRIHLDNLALQTGVTRFQEAHRRSRAPPPGVVIVERSDRGNWVYDKTEDVARLNAPDFWLDVDFVVCERPDKVPGVWEVVGSVEAFDGVGVRLRPQTGEREGAERAVHEVKVKGREVFFPEIKGGGLGKVTRVVALGVEKVGRRVAGWNGGWWPYIKVKEKLFVLKQGSLGV